MVVISEYFLSLNQWILRQKPFIMKFVGLRLTKNKKVHIFAISEVCFFLPEGCFERVRISI